MKKRIIEHVEKHMQDYTHIVKEMYDHPELGNEEFASAKLLCNYLMQEGFTVSEQFILPTGFKGVYDSEKPGAKIAYLCEYDALPDVGHGCGHNLIAAMSLAAGCALKEIVKEVGGSVTVIGTPAEETFGGKVEMAKADVFKQYDAALMIHPDTVNQLGSRTLAINPVRFEFFGKNAHACTPYEGKSALDAAVLSYTSINMMRQFAKANTFIHGVIADGGKAANVIPAYARLDYYFRSDQMSYAQELTKKAEECVKGACIATGCDYQMSIYECPYDDCMINYQLCELLNVEYENLGLSDILPVDEVPSGSSDVGSTSYQCPTLQGYIKIAEPCVLGHSVEFANATISKTGNQALHDGAIALAMVGKRLLCEQEVLEEVKAEFKHSLEKSKQR